MLKALIRNRATVLAFLLSFVLVAPSVQAAPTHKTPTMMAMTADLVLVRPITFSVMVVGAILWVPAGMIAAASGGNFKESANVMVARPAIATFVRCLGCTEPGYRKD